MYPIEAYRDAFPNLPEARLHRLMAVDGFIRRAAQLPHPFALKGSALTRQYLPDPARRLPADLDFVLLPHQEFPQMAEEKLTHWAAAVTALDLGYDGIDFVPFGKNRFSAKGSDWFGVDYAMGDDFPTVCTRLCCRIGGRETEITLDITLNLDIPRPHPLAYATPFDRFTVPLTVPLPQQIAWKLHQTIVRPRFKDLYDLGWLARAAGSLKTVHETLSALAGECRRDGIGRSSILKLFDYSLPQTFAPAKAHNVWQEQKQTDALEETCPDLPPTPQETFVWFADNMQAAGFTRETAENTVKLSD